MLDRRRYCSPQLNLNFAYSNSHIKHTNDHFHHFQQIEHLAKGRVDKREGFWQIDFSPKREAFCQGRPLLEPGTVWNAWRADLHDFEQSLGDVGQRVERKPFSVRRRHAVASVGAAEALALGPGGRPEGRRRGRLDFGDPEELVELWQREFVQAKSKKSLRLV